MRIFLNIRHRARTRPTSAPQAHIRTLPNHAYNRLARILTEWFGSLFPARLSLCQEPFVRVAAVVRDDGARAGLEHKSRQLFCGLTWKPEKGVSLRRPTANPVVVHHKNFGAGLHHGAPIELESQDVGLLGRPSTETLS